MRPESLTGSARGSVAAADPTIAMRFHHHGRHLKRGRSARNASVCFYLMTFAGVAWCWQCRRLLGDVLRHHTRLPEMGLRLAVGNRALEIDGPDAQQGGAAGGGWIGGGTSWGHGDRPHFGKDVVRAQGLGWSHLPGGPEPESWRQPCSGRGWSGMARDARRSAGLPKAGMNAKQRQSSRWTGAVMDC